MKLTEPDSIESKNEKTYCYYDMTKKDKLTRFHDVVCFCSHDKVERKINPDTGKSYLIKPILEKDKKLICPLIER